jgi:hypothetical protein
MFRKFVVLALLGIPQAIWSEESNDEAGQSENVYEQYNALHNTAPGTVV